jgi:hypothetical protein
MNIEKWSGMNKCIFIRWLKKRKSSFPLFWHFRDFPSKIHSTLWLVRVVRLFRGLNPHSDLHLRLFHPW